jgi:hypothetical protein
MRSVFAALVVAGCSSTPPPLENATPISESTATPVAVATAIVGTSSGLRAVPADGGAIRELTAAKVEECGVDRRSGVVWFFPVYEELWLFDLESSGPAVKVISGLISPSVVVAYGSGDEVELGWSRTTPVVTRLEADSTPSLGVDVRCHESDEEMEEPCDRAALRQQPEVVDEQAKLASATLAASNVIAELADRRRPPEPPLKSRGPASRVPGVPVDGCHIEPDACGAARPIPGTRYLAVETANFARGPTLGHFEQIYDPETREYLDALDTRRRSKVPFGDGEVHSIADSELSPDHLSILHLDGRVVSIERGVLFEGEFDGGTSCGWISL